MPPEGKRPKGGQVEPPPAVPVILGPNHPAVKRLLATVEGLCSACLTEMGRKKTWEPDLVARTMELYGLHRFETAGDVAESLGLILTVKDAAKLLTATEWQVYSLIRAGVITAIRFGPRSTRVPVKPLVELIEKAAAEGRDLFEMADPKRAAHQSRWKRPRRTAANKGHDDDSL